MSVCGKAHGWRELQPVRLPLAAHHDQPARAFAKGPCRVLVGREDHIGKLRWHLSISCSTRYPGWEEIKDARYSLLPVGLTFAQILPPLNQYVNVHPNCFHLWEIDDGEW
jgi:hypothetical protein